MFVGWQVIATRGHALSVTLVLDQPLVSKKRRAAVLLDWLD